MLVLDMAQQDMGMAKLEQQIHMDKLVLRNTALVSHNMVLVLRQGNKVV